MAPEELGGAGNPLRVAIVGSGPSGFYAAQALYKANLTVEIDMFDRLPTPYGLVRHGVAPDHQKIKNSTAVFAKIASKEGFAFWGNVTVGRDISVDELASFYHAVIFAYGAESDRRLNIPGEDLPGSYTATEFVAWYNGHPDYRDHTFDLSHETAVVIGQGNVAVDVCRILLKTVDELKGTDIAAHALEALAESRVREVHMIGRRGPVQAKFTQVEIKELGRLEDADPIVQPKYLEFDALSQAEYDDPKNKSAARIVPILLEFSQRPAPTKNGRLHIDFLLGPRAILGKQRVEKIVLEHNELVGEPFHLSARGTGETEELACGLVFRSVGYRGTELEGVPFNDDWGVVANEEGRVVENGAPKRGYYAVGWIKRGPSGVIGTNKPDSAETVKALLQDLGKLGDSACRGREAVLNLLQERGIRPVSFEDWKAIDAEEVARGSESGKPREKFTRIEEIIAFLDGRGSL